MKRGCVLLLCLFAVVSKAAEVGGRLDWRLTNSTVALSTFVASNSVVHLQGAENLPDWTTFATIYRQAVDYEVDLKEPQRFFRAISGTPNEFMPFSNQIDGTNWASLNNFYGSWLPPWSKFV